MSKSVQIGVRLCLLAYAGLLGLILIASFDLFNTSWPFELFASYMRLPLLILPIMLGLTLWAWRLLIAPALILALWTFWPLITFSQYKQASHEACPAQGCIKVLSANLQGNMQAINAAAQSAALHQIDIVTLLEIPPQMSTQQIEQAFSQLPYGIMLSKNLDGYVRRMRLAVLSRHPLSLLDGEANNAAQNKGLLEIGGPRYISAMLHKADAAPVQIISLHPLPPMTPNLAWGRDQTLGEAAASIKDTDNFIMMGDFNTTPWTPAFRALPGQRAGDPRFISTWNHTRPLMGIPIDHIMIGDNIEVISSELEPPTPSDHIPITATLLLK